MSDCPGCGLANYEGLCPHCRGDAVAYENELVPYGFPSLREPSPCTCGAYDEGDLSIPHSRGCPMAEDDA